jgi:predicted transcriptional regulator
MGKSNLTALSRRERQIMEIVYAQGRVTAAEIQRKMSDPPSNSTVRTLLRVLVEKGYLSHESDGPRYVYSPCIPAEKAKRSALEQLLRTFFNNSAVSAMAALLDMSLINLPEAEIKRLSRLIDHARAREGGHSCPPQGRHSCPLQEGRHSCPLQEGRHSCLPQEKSHD